jgi:hypothetical protein
LSRNGAVAGVALEREYRGRGRQRTTVIDRDRRRDRAAPARAAGRRRLLRLVVHPAGDSRSAPARQSTGALVRTLTR